ncbi:MAG: hypothetical protein GY871_04235 [Actinomycetales bacterium]|nr:hypothetical protein [Actinomycetales bacterium]
MSGTPQIVVVTGHAVDRYAQHHPRCSRGSLARAWSEGDELDPLLAMSLLGRTQTPKRGDRYRISPCKRGIFAGREEGEKIIIVTYLRLGQVSRRIACGEQEPATPEKPKEVVMHLLRDLAGEPEGRFQLGGRMNISWADLYLVRDDISLRRPFVCREVEVEFLPTNMNYPTWTLVRA